MGICRAVDIPDAKKRACVSFSVVFSVQGKQTRAGRAGAGWSGSSWAIVMQNLSASEVVLASLDRPRVDAAAKARLRCVMRAFGWERLQNPSAR